MIHKKRGIPVRLRMEEALLRRLPQNHKKLAKILQNFKKGKAGSLVTILYPSTIIKTPSNNQVIFQKLLHAEHIPDKIEELIQSTTDSQLTSYQIKKITQLLLHQHIPLSFDALTHYSISKNDLIIGVPCPHCPTQSMQKIYGKWICPHCQWTSFDHHVQVVYDHLLLCGPLSNAQMREILQMDSPHTIKRLLQKMNLPTKGNKKGRVYFLE